MTDLQRLAEIADEAALCATAIPQFSDTHTLSVDQGYAIQTLSMNRRYARGDRRIGIKMGFTSRAKQLQMGLDDLIWGRLTESMRLEEGGCVSMSRFVHPRVEPEVAYLIRHRLEGNVSALEALNAVAGVAPAMEIIDSRFADFKFDVADVVADNTSAAGFVIGDWYAPGTDVANLGLILSINGRPRQIGSTAAILGNPARALVAAARMAASAGEALCPGDIVLAGAATAAVEFSAGDHVQAQFETLGSINFSIVD
ncbi:2-keto-4-pentenoate hydratase [Devosia sp. A369]